MTDSRHKEHEVIFIGQHLRLLRAGLANDDSARLLKTPVDEAAGRSVLSQLAHEYDICRDLDLAGILRPTDKETVGGRPAIVFEDPGGVTLAQLLAAGPVDLPLFFNVAIELADIISRLHRKGVVHKDIHSGNIMVCTDGDPVRVYLTGLGIASLLPGQSVEKFAPDKLEGTLSVMSPEQTGRMNRPVDFRTDFYSLGAVLYQMLTGRLPFAGDDPLALVHAHLAKVPKAPSEIDANIPSMLSDLVLKLLAKDADDRYRSAAGIAADLNQCRDDWHRTGTISPFELARQDLSETFHIPDKLYGRQEEIRPLQAAFDRICGGPVEVVLVTGYAGIGKTELVHQIRKSVVQKDGYYIAGKCDPLDRKIPCAPFVEAFNDAVDQLFASLHQKRINIFKKILARTLGDQGRVLTDVIPMLSLFIGEQPTVHELPPDQARNRLHLMLQRLFAAATLRGFPLVLFLDDLQWADFSTLKMLQTLACDTDLCNLLLIGAYRDQEVDETHALTHTLKEIDTAGGRIQTMALGPMPAEAVSALIADALEASQESVGDLAALCRQKTGGNPFFLKRFLLELVGRKLIFFDTTRNAWQWHADKIARAHVTDNVVELMAGTIAGLDEHVQQALKTAACIGSRFDLDTLGMINDMPPQTQLNDLWPAIQSGLISALSGPGLRFVMGPDGTLTTLGTSDHDHAEQIRFAFLHDRIQEAAYGLMSEDQRMNMHLRIGRLLLKRYSQKKLDEEIFYILGQLNRVVPLITKQEERDSLAELNFKAGQRARSMALFESAFDYFRMGIDLMATEGWQGRYELTKELHLKGIEAAFISGRHSEMDDWFETAVYHIHSPVDPVDAYIIKIEKEASKLNFKGAIDTSLAILARLGLNLPDNPTEADVKIELQKTADLLSSFSNEDILDLPPMENPVHLAISSVLLVLLPPTYFVNRALHCIVGCKSLRLMLRHGHSKRSAFILINYIVILCIREGKKDDIINYGQLSVRLMEHYVDPTYDSRVWYLFLSAVPPLYEHASKTVESLYTNYQSCLDNGVIEQAGSSLFTAELARFYIGEDLKRVDSGMTESRKMLLRIRHKSMVLLTDMHHQVVLNLMGRSAYTSDLIGEAFDERTVLPPMIEASHETFLFGAYCCRLMLTYLFEQFEEAAGLAEKIDNFQYVIHMPWYNSKAYCLSGLARLALCPTDSAHKNSAMLTKVAVNQKRLQRLADAAPMNYLHQLSLLKAERARVEGQILAAQNHFDQAIELAEENGYLQCQALANELAAKFWMGRGKAPIARLYMRQAVNCYTHWGAAAKVRDLQEKHPEYFTAAEAAMMPADITVRGAADLDVMSALRASRAISGEIVLDRLMEKLMDVVIENAGATCGRLLLETDGRLYVAAEAGADRPGEIFQPDQAVSIENASHLLPLQLVQYVRRTGKPLVMEDAPTEERFARDPYILKNRPRSVLCSPIVHQDKLIGLLYLDNNLAAGAFTDERLKMLEILSAQIAVSLENARLYNSLEKLVHERTAQLFQAKEQAEVAKEQAEAANQAKSSFLANMSHELRTPLNVIMGYSQLMQKGVLSPAEQQEHLATINRNGEHLLTLINDVLEISRIEAGQLTIESTTFDLPAMFYDLETAFASSLDDKGLYFKIMGIDDLPRFVATDETKLRQVLVNLLSNAVKFTEQGGITMRVAVKNETAGAMRLAVEVQDTGVGIAEDEMDKVFACFDQTASGRAKKIGTGLGMAISRNYVRMMGGDISVTSKAGQGSNFSFEIDIKKGRKKDIKARGSRQRVMGLQPGQKVPRVLVAEDKSDSRALLVKFLKTAGFEVEEAVNGKEAVEMFNQWRPDFVWMDIRMPVMDGREATRRIKETDAGQSTIVAALTAHALEEEKDKILAAGLDDFVAKPFREQEIFEVMAKHLGLEYVYEEESVAEDAQVETEAEVTPQQLAALPDDIRNRLHQATVELNESKCLKIIEQIKVHDADMAAVLRTIVNQFEFRRLLDLLQGKQAKTEGSP